MRFGTLLFVKENEGDFVKLLSEIKEPFKAFRYLFEDEVELPSYKLENAINCLQAAIFEISEIIEPKYNALF